MDVKEQYPLSPEGKLVKDETDSELAGVFEGKSEKKIIIAGPCSADREDAVLDYCTRLRKVSEKVKDKLIVVARVYTNKPRTTGSGYKGMLHQPVPGEKPDPFRGILATRALHADVLSKAGMPTADELLYPANFRYLSDLISYISVGARSTENQEHRLTASGLDIPVGMKNPTGGSFEVMLNSVIAARHGHSFIYRGWDVDTTGNPLAHGIIRGYTDMSGAMCPNYGYGRLCALNELFACSGIENPGIIVDTNHANSGKNPMKQPQIALDVTDSCKKNKDLSHMVKGFMIESYIEGGCQAIGPDEIYGKSITDPCLDFESTERLIYKIADMI